MPTTIPDPSRETGQRIHAAWRARALAAGISVGAQVFLFGTGAAMPISLNGAWIASLAALPASALLTAICLKKGIRRRVFFPLRAVLIVVSLLSCCVFAVSSLIILMEQTLLPQAQAAWIAVITVLFLLVASLGGSTGASRLCFALRFFLPGALLMLSAASLPLFPMDGLFPLLGAGVWPLFLSCLCMLSAPTPVLMLLLPPREIDPDCDIPRVSFFLWRVLAGAGTGALLLLFLSAGSTYASIADTWGMRLMIASSAKPHEGVVHTLLILCQCAAFFLLALCSLLGAEDALFAAFPRLKKSRLSLLPPAAALSLLLVLLVVFGFVPALSAAPFSILPGLAALLPCPRRADKRHKKETPL